MSKSTCEKCGSDYAVKANKVVVGPWGEYEYLCRACRFESSVQRRQAVDRDYFIRFTNGIGAPCEMVFRAKTAGEAIEMFQERYPYATWDECNQLTLIRRRAS